MTSRIACESASIRGGGHLGEEDADYPCPIIVDRESYGDDFYTRFEDLGIRPVRSR